MIPTIVRVYSFLGPTFDATYCLTRFCSSPPTPSISSGASPSTFVYHISISFQSHRGKRGLTRSRSAPASNKTTAASPCPLSKARCNGVLPKPISATRSKCQSHWSRRTRNLPARSDPFKRVFGRPSGGLRRICKNA